MKHKKIVENITLLALCFICTIPVLSNLFTNFPYYNYIDEGHVLLWTESFYKEKAPLRIFYGPLQFYLITFVDAFHYIISNLTTTGINEYLSKHSTPQFYNDFRHSNLLIIGRLISLISLIVATYYIFISGKNLSKSKAIGVLSACYFITQLWIQEVATYVQPEILALALLTSIIAYLTKTNSDSTLKYKGNISENIFLAILFALLASTKLYFLLFSILPIIILYNKHGIMRAIESSLVFYFFLFLFLFIIYLPYRTPVELYEMFKFAGHYYDGKKNSVPLIASLIHQENISVAQWVAILFIPFALFRFNLSIMSRSLVFLSLVCLLYFSQYTFSNTRNLIIFNIITTIIFVEFLFILKSTLSKKRACVAIAIISSILISTNIHGLMGFVNRSAMYEDSRNSPIINDLINGDTLLVVDTKLQVFTGNRKLVSYTGTIEPDHIKHTENIYILSSKTLDSDLFPLCSFEVDLGNKTAVHEFFFIKNPKIFVYYCQLENSANLEGGDTI